jgi:NAD(P)H-dependent FMN reductase
MTPFFVYRTTFAMVFRTYSRESRESRPAQESGDRWKSARRKVRGVAAAIHKEVLGEHRGEGRALKSTRIVKDGDGVVTRVTGLAGSLREESFTRMAVRYALKGAEEEGAEVEMLDLGSYDLPFLGREKEEPGARDVERFRIALRAADGIILGSPEIHGSFSGVLKNALDLTGSDEFEGKMVGLVGVAGGQLGAVETLSQLRTVGRSLHAWVVPEQVSIGDSSSAFNRRGEPVRPEIGIRLRSVGRQVAHFAYLHKCENHIQFVKEWEGAPRTSDTVDSKPVTR